MYRVVTDLAILGFDSQSHEMVVCALHPGVEMDRVRDNTGFEIVASPEITRTEPPRLDELKVLRELDPERLYTA